MSAGKKKKGTEEPTKILFGRPGNNLKMGIVGLPNVGKSTLFNVLGKLSVPAENFPFCTIDPNVCKVEVPDRRFNWLVDHWKPKSIVRASLTITDIAGLVKGAADGEGLGNAFLSHIRAVDGIYHVVRAFENKNVTHVEESVDPVRDLEIITDELRLKDMQFIEKKIPELEKVAQKVDRTKKFELATVNKVYDFLKNKKDIRSQSWSAKEIEVINGLLLLTAKPVIYLVNLSPRDYARKRNKHLSKIAEWVKDHGDWPIIPFSASFEGELTHLEADEKKKHCEKIGATSTIPKIIRTGYHGLDLVHFFTTGKDEVRAWTVRKNTKAPNAAGVIHTDFCAGFVCAEVTPFLEFKKCGSESAAKSAGKTRTQGKEYIVKDGDIMFIKAGRVNKKKK